MGFHQAQMIMHYIVKYYHLLISTNFPRIFIS